MTTQDTFKVRVGDDGQTLFESPFYGEACDRAAEISQTGWLRQAYVRHFDGRVTENVARYRDGELVWTKEGF